MRKKVGGARDGRNGNLESVFSLLFLNYEIKTKNHYYYYLIDENAKKRHNICEVYSLIILIYVH